MWTTTDSAPVVDLTQALRLSCVDNEINQFEATGRFSATFLASLEDLRFTGSAEAIQRDVPDRYLSEPLAALVAQMDPH